MYSVENLPQFPQRIGHTWAADGKLHALLVILVHSVAWSIPGQTAKNKSNK